MAAYTLAALIHTAQTVIAMKPILAVYHACIVALFRLLLDCKLGASAIAATLQNVSTVLGGHSFQETVFSES